MGRYFNGVGDSYRIAVAPVATGPVTLSCWTWIPVAAVAPGNLWGSYNGATDTVFLRINTTGLAQVSSATTSVASNQSGTVPMKPGVWHHLCGICASTTDLRIYTDGSDRQQTITAVKVPVGLNTTIIGSRDGTSNWALGRIAECAMWNAALNDDEVLLLAQGLSPLLVRRQSLRSYIPLRDETFLSDRAGGITGAWTLTGGPRQVDHPLLLPPLKPHFRPWRAMRTASILPSGNRDMHSRAIPHLAIR